MLPPQVVTTQKSFLLRPLLLVALLVLLLLTSLMPATPRVLSFRGDSCDVSFSDVPAGSPFHDYVQCLACREIVGGYGDGSFRYNSNVTRGQLAKFVANAAGFAETYSTSRFSDVSTSSPFFQFIERLASRGIVGGYTDSTFRPESYVTRGQLAKFVANAAGFGETYTVSSFSDVATNNPFHQFVERLAEREIVGGYAEGTFRPGNDVTRGQVTKFVANTFFPDCQDQTSAIATQPKSPLPTALIVAPVATASATRTRTAFTIASATRTVQPTSTSTRTPTRAATSTQIPTATKTLAVTATRTASRTATHTAILLTATWTGTATRTATRTNTAVVSTVTQTATRTKTVAASTATRTYTAVVNTATRTATPTATRTSTVILSTATRTVTRTNTAVVNTATGTATRTATRTSTALANTATVSPTRTNTAVPNTATKTVTSTATHTNTVTATRTITSTPSHTKTAVVNTATRTATPTLTNTAVVNTATRTATPTATPSNTAVANTATRTATHTNTAVPSTATHTPTRTTTPTNTATRTATLINTVTRTATLTSTVTRTATPPNTVTRTATLTNTTTSTHTSVPNTATATATRTNTLVVNTATRTATATAVAGCTTGTWAQPSSYPISITQPAVVALGSLFYSFGGYSNGATASSYKYEPISGVWSSIADLPAARAEAAAVTDGTYIYILNGIGYDGGNPVQHNTLYRYNPANNTYTTLAPAPRATYSHAAVYLNGKIYRIAGNSGLLTNSVDAYTISSDSWAPAGTVPDYPLALQGLGAVASGGAIFVAGGTDSEVGSSNKTYLYTPGASAWNDLAVSDLPAARDGAAGGLLNGLWIIAGGEWGNSVTALNLTNPTGSWQTLAPLPQPRFYLAGAASGGRFLTVGGSDFEGRNVRDVQQYACQQGQALAAAVVPVPQLPGAAFSDVQSSDDFYVAVQYLAGRNIISPYEDGTYRPHNPTTRGQLVKMVVLAAGGNLVRPGVATFSDVPVGSTFFTYIETALTRRMISGYSNGTFRPNANLTRGQMTKIVLLGLLLPVLGSNTTHFADVPSVSAFFRYVETAYALGLVGGYSDGLFRPANMVTRGQVAKTVYLGIKAAE